MKFYGGGGHNKRIAKNKSGKEEDPRDSFNGQVEGTSSPELAQRRDVSAEVPASDGIPEVLTPRQERKRVKSEKKQAKLDKKIAKKIAKKQRTPAEKWKRRILTLVIILAVFAVGFSAFKLFVQPPDTKAANTDSEQGDALTIQEENRKDDYFTFFIGATDEDGTRTDSMMMVSMNIADGEVNVLNIPRDTMSDVTRTNKKINGAYNKGIEGTRKEIHQLLGFDFDKYIVFSFDAIEQFADIVGGVDYDVPINMYYDDPSQDLHIHFTKGQQHLDGEEVVEFLRWRKNNDGTGYPQGDIDRIAKQQEFLKVLAGRFMTPANIIKIPEMAQCISENVKSDITKGQLIWLGIQAFKIGSSNINMFVLPGESRYISPLSYYVAFEDQTLEMLNEYFNPYTYELTSNDVDIIAPSSTGKLTTTNKNNDDLGTITEDDTEADKETNHSSSSSGSDKTNKKEDDSDSGESSSSKTSSDSDSKSNDDNQEPSGSASTGSNSSKTSSSGSSSDTSSGNSSSSSSTESDSSSSSAGSNTSTPVDPEL